MFIFLIQLYCALLVKWYNEAMVRLNRKSDSCLGHHFLWSDKMSNKIYTINEIKQKLKELLFGTDVSTVTLFGSYAKNKATKESDIDLVIDSNGKLMGFKLFSLITKIENLFKKDVDAFEKSEIIAGSQIDNEIKKTGVTVYES